MVSPDNIKKGIEKYLDEEIMAKLGGWQKWVFGVTVSILLEDTTPLVDKLKSNAVIKMLNVIDEAGNVDVEKLYSHFKRQAHTGSITFEMPMIGAVTLNEADVDKIYKCITNKGGYGFAGA